MPTPVESLLGMELDGGWLVTERANAKDYSTGGNFSKGYKVRRKHDDREAFLKALDVTTALSGTDMMRDLEVFVRDYNFETSVNDHCRGLDRVVSCVSHGYADVVPGDPLGRVPYLIFEKADGDIRRLMASLPGSLAWRFSALHHMATGLTQLHGKNVAHQDLKPSNVMVFSTVSKVGDLGRASCATIQSRYDQFAFAGDRNYAPPEILYRRPLRDLEVQRRATDAFMLASMVVYLLGGVTLQARLLDGLPTALHPNNKGCTFDQALPSLQANLAKCVEQIRIAAGPLGVRAAALVGRLGEPDPAHRGHPKNAIGFQDQYGLRRFVSELDLLAKRAREANL